MDVLDSLERRKKKRQSSPIFIFCVVVGLLGLVFYGISSSKEEDSPDLAPAVEDQYVKKDNSLPNPVVWFSVRIGGHTLPEKIFFELFADVVPRTAENFRSLCIGNMRRSDGKRLSYRGSHFYNIVPGRFVCGGDITSNNGTGGYSIYGSTFPNENFRQSHTQRYMLSMANVKGPDTTSSQFYITTAPAPSLDGRHVVIGKVIAGYDTVDAIEIEGMKKKSAAQLITIVDSGEITNEDVKLKLQASARERAKQECKKQGYTCSHPKITH
mmetsp:Transcript_12864/g.17775  ORF Transcript_12864/g.17775 Transcript_12864/m.17775 type:complete len:269 (-) Transcript_12864:178-984(-)|eukprot:CAMPEP_0184479838 /NCGR_PEP_ID=MMETSP0113_2-20130426/1403_1 /TAXON_ID=91329 /ORGANISM="Norrisiella sphaerica, Strain BC52" /LENGTH=268 /DNA_ID=CAMNT_0026857999 /DNA_START=324 /DNA_END=1130 /DNA_ORIENTATION=-